ncbi:MAG: HAD family hydrolase [Massiliimalia sp.]|jgi:putative hydrolase of the HAD superfamily
MIKAVLFDFDGVLTTDATGSLSICKYITQVTGVGFSLFSDKYRGYNRDLLYGKKIHNEIWEELCQRVGMQIPYQILIDSFENTPIDEKMLELVHALKDCGYQVGMITDNKKDRIDCIVKHCGWEQLFDVIVVSADVGSGKEEDTIFRAALEKLNLPASQCVFIDNQQKNLTVPENMGMKTIYYDHETRNFQKLLKQLQEIGVLQ